MPIPPSAPRPVTRRRALLARGAGLTATAALAACARGTVGPAAIRNQTPEATVTMSLVQAGFLGTGGGGNGVLTFQGRDLPFGVVGGGLGGIGASTVEAEGEVFDLGGDVSRFPGTYAQVRVGAVAGTASVGEMWLQNQAGTIIRVRTRRTGLMLAMGGDAVRITLR